MLALLIPQTNASVLFVLMWDFMLFLVLLGLFLINQVYEGLNKSKTFWLANDLVEADTGQKLVAACHLSYEMSYH